MSWYSDNYIDWKLQNFNMIVILILSNIKKKSIFIKLLKK